MTAAAAGIAPRRSGRERKQVESIYSEAAKQEDIIRKNHSIKTKTVGAKTSRPRKGGRKRKPSDDDASDDDENGEAVGVTNADEIEGRSVRSSESEESSSESDDDEEEESDDENFKTKKRTTNTAAVNKVPSETQGKKGRGAAIAARQKTKVATGRSPVIKGEGGKKKTVGMGGGTAKSPMQRSAHQALAILAKNVLPEGETPGLSSLVAGLLHSYRPTKEEVDMGDLPHLSEYTPNLVALARKVIQVHNDHPNRAQLALLNLLFRSVGGGPETDLSLGLKNTRSGSNKPRTNSRHGTTTDDEDDSNTDMETADEKEDEEVILDDMDTDEWARVVTDLFDDMRHVPANQILICADPLGAVHQAYELNEREARGKGTSNDNADHSKDAKKPPPVAVGAVEYRKIYIEFWYILGHIALIEGGMATTSSSDFESTGKDNAPVVRLDAELVKNLILRIIELSPVGQPDVRAAATLAALSMSHAALDQSSILAKKMDVASRQYAAAKKNKSPGGGGQGGAKVEALKVRIESLKRCVEDLEEVVLGPVIQGLFVHRYRDSNEHIRTMCISSLSRMSLQRPDIFLTDKYLKYFGWMMHDKDPLVRGAALDGLLKPFQAVQNAVEGKARLVGDENLMIEKIDLSTLEHVVAKFLPRIADSVMDRVGSVQEVAMTLMLVLLKGGFLDEVNDDKLWDQTNQRCLAEDAPPDVQKNALYFVIEQLEAFDDGGENEKAAPNEHKRAQQLDAIASFAAHTLTNGPVPIDKIQVKVVDLLVKSLREMPEHRGLVTDWNAMLRAIKDDNAAATATLITAGDRANVAKQRLLVRMLACAAREEVGSVAETEFLNRGTDPDTAERSSLTIPKAKGRPTGREHENLSIALLKALPNLLIQFKGDSAIIPELASLPRFLVPTVFSLPQRKQDFMSLIKNLGEIYLSSSDTRILENTARSLINLCDGDHARLADSKNQLRNMVIELRDRIVELMSSDDSTIATSAFSVCDPDSDFTSVARSKRRSARKKSQTSSPASDKTSLTDDDTKETADADAEYSIFLNLKRLRILSKKCDLSVFFDDRNNVNQLELLCNFVCDGLKSRLRACKPVDLRVNADEETTVNKVIDGPEALGAIGKSVSEGLEFVLCVIAWFTKSVQVSESLIVEDVDLVSGMGEDDEEDSSVTDHVVIRLRNALHSTLELCFAQFIPTSFVHGDGESTVVQHSEEQHSFSDFIQLTAGKVTSDLRTLFPKEYADASSPILRSFALQEDGSLIGAYVRFLDSKEHLLRDYESASFSGERQLAQSLLFPIGRAVATNWTNGNRREAGVLLRHISASGPTATDIILVTSRQMKKIDPVRMLESQMASLRQSFEHWVNDTPELDTDFPSEEEMALFENEENAHKLSFAKLEYRASQFSHTLGGFGKLGTPILGPALHGFIREGIRFSFSNLDENEEDSLVLGSRLSFLLLLSKYATWIKKDKKHKSDIQEYVDRLESQLRSHEEFEQVHTDDLEALAIFRQVVGLKALSNKSGRPSVSTAGISPDNDVDGEESLDNVSDLPSPVASTGGKSAGSRNSRSSRPSCALPTLPEAESEESPQDGDSDSDTISQFSSSKHSFSLMSAEQSIEDKSESSHLGSETSYRPKRRKS